MNTLMLLFYDYKNAIFDTPFQGERFIFYLLFKKERLIDKDSVFLFFYKFWSFQIF